MCETLYVLCVSTGKEEISRNRGEGKEIESIHNKIYIHVCTCLYVQWIIGKDDNKDPVVASERLDKHSIMSFPFFTMTTAFL